MEFMRKCKALLSAAGFAVLIACCSSAQIPKNDPTEVTQSEYEVFSEYVAHYFVGRAAKERIGLPVSQLIIVDTTEYDVSEIEEDMPWEEMQKFLRKEVPSLQAATIKNFREMNLRQAHLDQRFDLPLPYELVTGSTLDSIIHDVSDWTGYYKRYPGAQGFLTLSRVGFSSDGNQAFFYASNHCGGKCATGSFTVAQKRGNRWAIVKEVIVWVS
jgi:hypothetical protein